MTTKERATIAAGRRVEVNIRGRRFFATVTGRSGVKLDIDPEPPTVAGKGFKATYRTCQLKDVIWAAPRWSPTDALR